MLDTNTCIALIKRRPAYTIRKLQLCEPDDIVLSTIVLAELSFGVEKSERKEKNRIALREFALNLHVAAFDDKAAQTYGAIRLHLERKGMTIGAMDMLIGAHASALGLTLVTHNLKEFRRIPRLSVVDWLGKQ